MAHWLTVAVNGEQEKELEDQKAMEMKFLFLQVSAADNV